MLPSLQTHLYWLWKVRSQAQALPKSKYDKDSPKIWDRGAIALMRWRFYPSWGIGCCFCSTAHSSSTSTCRHCCSCGSRRFQPDRQGPPVAQFILYLIWLSSSHRRWRSVHIWLSLGGGRWSFENLEWHQWIEKKHLHGDSRKRPVFGISFVMHCWCCWDGGCPPYESPPTPKNQWLSFTFQTINSCLNAATLLTQSTVGSTGKG